MRMKHYINKNKKGWEQNIQIAFKLWCVALSATVGWKIYGVQTWYQNIPITDACEEHQ